MVHLQEQILQDEALRVIIDSQQTNGWVGKCFKWEYLQIP